MPAKTPVVVVAEQTAQRAAKILKQCREEPERGAGIYTMRGKRITCGGEHGCERGKINREQTGESHTWEKTNRCWWRIERLPTQGEWRALSPSRTADHIDYTPADAYAARATSLLSSSAGVSHSHPNNRALKQQRALFIYFKNIFLQQHRLN